MKNEQTAYEAVQASLQKLGMDYADLVLLHQPMGDYFAAYRGLEKAYKDGLTRASAWPNFYPGVLTNLCENVEIIPAVNQVELHPFFVQQKAIDNMKAYGVVPQAWGPLAEGKHGIFTDPELTEIGKKYGKSAAQVVLRWERPAGRVHYPQVGPCGADEAEHRHLGLYPDRRGDGRDRRQGPGPQRNRGSR